MDKEGGSRAEIADPQRIDESRVPLPNEMVQFVGWATCVEAFRLESLVSPTRASDFLQERLPIGMHASRLREQGAHDNR